MDGVKTTWRSRGPLPRPGVRDLREGKAVAEIRRISHIACLAMAVLWLAPVGVQPAEAYGDKLSVRPLSGWWRGTTSQGHLLTFKVSRGGTRVEPFATTITIECSGGSQAIVRTPFLGSAVVGPRGRFGTRIRPGRRRAQVLGPVYLTATRVGNADDGLDENRVQRNRGLRDPRGSQLESCTPVAGDDSRDAVFLKSAETRSTFERARCGYSSRNWRQSAVSIRRAALVLAIGTAGLLGGFLVVANGGAAPPQTSEILFETNRAGSSDLFSVNNAGRQLPLTKGIANEAEPSASAVGSPIVFASDDDGTWQIYLLSGGGRIRLTGSQAASYRPVWAPDGKRIAFETSRDGNWEIYVMNADGTQETNVSRNGGDDFAPMVTEGRATGLPSRDWIEIRARDCESRHRCTGDASRSEPVVSSGVVADGGRIAFDRRVKGNYDIYVLTLESGAISGSPRAWPKTPR